MRPPLIVLLVAFAMLAETLAGSTVESDLHRLINDYYYAIGENRLEEAMGFYHEDSPEADRTSQELLYGQSAYLQRTSTLNLDLVQRDCKRAVLRAAHRHLRIVGIKFMETFTEAEYILHRQGDTWKIWSIKERRVSRQASPDVNLGGI